nr:MAG TPA: hypothetical protein [Caudoviricetes sp.]
MPWGPSFVITFSKFSIPFMAANLSHLKNYFNN